MVVDAPVDKAGASRTFIMKASASHRCNEADAYVFDRGARDLASRDKFSWKAAWRAVRWADLECRREGIRFSDREGGASAARTGTFLR